MLRMRGSLTSTANTNHPVRVACLAACKQYGSVPAVDGISFEVPQGEILAVVGPSGCGKTTLLRLLAGFETPDAGAVSLGERVVAGPGAWVPPEDRHVGMVFQDYALFPHMSVAQNVEFGIKGWDRESRIRRVAELLELVHLTHLAHRKPHELSGGEQQRVALVRSLAPRPSALFLDEPFSNLDTGLRVEMREEVREIVRTFGVTTVHVTHDQEEALFMGARVAVMRRGKLEQLGTPEEVYHRPRTRFVAGFMGVADFLPATITSEGLSSEVGVLSPSANDAYPQGSKVDVLVRPDMISLSLESRGESSGVAKVQERIFRGLDYLYTLSLPSGLLLHSIQATTVRFDVGQRVGITINPGQGPLCFPVDGVHETSPM